MIPKQPPTEEDDSTGDSPDAKAKFDASRVPGLVITPPTEEDDEDADEATKNEDGQWQY